MCQLPAHPRIFLPEKWHNYSHRLGRCCVHWKRQHLIRLSCNSESVVSSESDGQCTCSPGYNGADGDQCVACGEGTYKLAKCHLGCSSCGSGNYNGQTARTVQNACLPCDKGTKFTVQVFTRNQTDMTRFSMCLCSFSTCTQEACLLNTTTRRVIFANSLIKQTMVSSVVLSHETCV